MQGGPSFSCRPVWRQRRRHPPYRQPAHRSMQAFLYNMVTLPSYTHAHTHTHCTRDTLESEEGVEQWLPACTHMEEFNNVSQPLQAVAQMDWQPDSADSG